jgi:hypothetical protein
MPQIIVRTCSRNGKVGEATLTERAVPTEQHNDHYIAQLIERIGWALIDAERLESHANPSKEIVALRGLPQSASGQSAGRRDMANKQPRHTRRVAGAEKPR